MNERELANQIKQIQEINKATPDHKIDVAAIAMAAMANQQANELSGKEKRIGYLVSLALPPFGLLYAVKFYASGKSDGKQGALMCLLLTAISIILFFAFSGLLFKSSGLTPGQLKQAPQQYQELVQ